MSDLHFYITLSVFAVVILAIAFDVIDMTLAALLGVSILVAFGILNEADIMAATKTAGGPLLLLFGGMVVARTLSTTGIFERVGNIYLRATRGSGKRSSCSCSCSSHRCARCFRMRRRSCCWRP